MLSLASKKLEGLSKDNAMSSTQTEVGYNTKIEGDVIVTKADAVLNWFRKNSLGPCRWGLPAARLN